ncbi:coiled-coil domain-containing protein 30 isoform X2 [Nelusetta ayraudi]|uniref:coiled-coil domain-containing protein 30 isoform X2 n=1 Tax=Nelusetta ayraudi TaxID=303726 RepID=UPI003F6EC8B7
MAQPESHLQEELSQMAAWLGDEGLPPDDPWESQLRLLWRSFQAVRSRLSNVTSDLDAQRSKHLAEMAEVRRSLEQIRIFTEHKDALAQEIQDENDQLKEQLRQLISLQDSQISEVAKMLYQQGLTELIHSSPSEQVAYLLVERASLLESGEAPDRLTSDGNTAALLEMEAQVLETAAPQFNHKGATRHSQSPWKRLFGFHKQCKHTFIPAESRHLAGQLSSAKMECSRLERDLEEGSRRLAMAHTEIRHLTDELESAHSTQRAYEPELQAAQHEVQQLRQEVEKLKKYEMAELRKSKELNDRLDYEARALRNRIRAVDAENNSLQLSVISQQEMVKCLESALAKQRSELRLLTEHIEARQANEAPASDHEAENDLLATKEKCEKLKTEICETLQRLDKERSKYHEMREKHKAKLCRTKQRFEEEMSWRNEKISSLERELSLCSHSLAKEKELTRSVTAENDKLLNERRKLLQQLDEEQHNRQDNYLTASLSKCRVDFLDMENRKLAKKVLHVSSQLAVLERRLQNRPSAKSAEELKASLKKQIFPPPPVPTLSVTGNKSEEREGDSHTEPTHTTTQPHIFTSRSAEMRYLNLNSSQNHSEPVLLT